MRPLTEHQTELIEKLRGGWRLYANLESAWVERDAPYLTNTVRTLTFDSLRKRKVLVLNERHQGCNEFRLAARFAAAPSRDASE